MKRNDLLTLVMILFVGCDLNSGLGFLGDVVEKFHGKSVNVDGAIGDEIGAAIGNGRVKRDLGGKDEIVREGVERGPLPNIPEEQLPNPGDNGNNDLDDEDIDLDNDEIDLKQIDYNPYSLNDVYKLLDIFAEKSEKVRRKVQKAYDVWEKAYNADKLARKAYEDAFDKLKHFYDTEGEEKTFNNHFEVIQEFYRALDNFKQSGLVVDKAYKNYKKAEDYSLALDSKIDATIKVLQSPFVDKGYLPSDKEPSDKDLSVEDSDDDGSDDED
ncbi:hypothetical protein [Borrelia persica]|uniref:hypothetical protein n=1 Tax=Borrelia persica TaxID=44448 RepID=UPI0004669CC4|nr:hypothetical protein [Borrelia persica]